MTELQKILAILDDKPIGHSIKELAKATGVAASTIEILLMHLSSNDLVDYENNAKGVREWYTTGLCAEVLAVRELAKADAAQ